MEEANEAPKKETLTADLNFRIDGDLKGRATKAAQKLGMSLSKFIRTLLEAELKKNDEQSGNDKEGA